MRRQLRRVVSRRPARAAAAGLLAAIAVPGSVAAHRVSGVVDTPLPLVAYLAGAAVAVGLSFAFLALTDTAPTSASPPPARYRTVPRVVRTTLRLLGLVAWVWIVAQALVGGASDADVASLFLWVNGWIGLAIVSALVGPFWSWIDPFTTLYDVLAAVARRFGSASDERQASEISGYRPAVAGFVFFVWLELVVVLMGGRLLGLTLVGYTFITLAAMSWFGRDRWRAQGETFSVWFALLGRLAPLAHEDHPTAAAFAVVATRRA